MDKPISNEVHVKRRRVIILYSLLITVAILSAAWLLRSKLKPSLKRSEITTSIVEMGNIENTLNASGEVLPEFEEILSSPISASIKTVSMDAGSHVQAGQSILTLDKAATESEYEKLKFQLESKRNNIQKLKLQLDKSFYDLKANNEIKQLRINSLKAAVEDAKRLFKAGGGTRESIEQAELDLEVAMLEKKQLENEIRNKQQTMQVEMRESELAAKIEESDLRELQHKLDQASIVANRDGVVTWVNRNIGSTVQQGEALARIADLGSFTIKGNISDAYIEQVKTGMDAIIRINETQIRGTITNIQPSVQNGILSFNVQLADQKNKLLRPNMKVDIFVVTSTRANVMRVANGPAFKGTSTQDIFVLKDGKAERRTVTTGMSNFDFIEVKTNVKPGEEVITSDMSEYKNTREIKIAD